jgi:methanogenic corrinoid protein MtbC1
MSEALAALARTLKSQRGALAARANDEFFRRHPDWMERFGERGRACGEEDAAFLVDFLAGALDARLPSAFEDYLRWTARVLGARGIGPGSVLESIDVMEEALRGALGPAEMRLLEPYLASGRAGAAATIADAPAPAAPGAGADLALSRRLFTQAILAGARRRALDAALAPLRAGAGALDVYGDVVQESLYEVGRLWESNRISVAVEHMATAIAQYVLARLLPEIPAAPQSRGSAVVTGVSGELHQVGAHMVADALEADGWSVRFLGVNTPHGDILRVLDDHGASAVGISATMLTSVARVRDLVGAIRARRAAAAPRILVGGAVFKRFPDLVRDVGADATAGDVRAAVAAFRGPSPAS